MHKKGRIQERGQNIGLKDYNGNGAHHEAWTPEHYTKGDYKNERGDDFYAVYSFFDL